MKVLIIGGTGIISSAVVDEAINKGWIVTCVNRGNNHGIKPNPKVETLHFDIRNRADAEHYLGKNKYDVVVDFICYNLEQTKYSLELFHGKCKQYVFISTDSVYQLQKSGCYDESTPQSNPDWNYSYEKAECEKYIKKTCKKLGQIYTIVRPSITYGNTRIPYGLMPSYGYHGTFLERIKAGKPIPVWNNGNNFQTMMRVEDFASAMVCLWGNEKAYNQDFGICGDIVQWSDVLDSIEIILNVKINRINVGLSSIYKVFPERKGEFIIDRASDHKVSNAKLISCIPSYKAKFNLVEGIRKTIDYYRNNNNILGIDYNFDAKLDKVIKLNDKKNKMCRFVCYDNCRINNWIDYILAPYDKCILFRIYRRSKQFTFKVKKILR